MKQIYINTMLGTTRIDYDPNDARDIFINASICNIDEVVYDHIECTNINPEDIETVRIYDPEIAKWVMKQRLDQGLPVKIEDKATLDEIDRIFGEAMLEKERSMALYSDESPNEKYLRDLMGDDAYENYESQ